MSATVPIHVRRSRLHPGAMVVGAGLVLLAGTSAALVTTHDNGSTKHAPAPVVAPAPALKSDPLVNRYAPAPPADSGRIKRF